MHFKGRHFYTEKSIDKESIGYGLEAQNILLCFNQNDQFVGIQGYGLIGGKSFLGQLPLP